jgi:3',5'-cyclic AMP phosphodiesterase CpdA
MPSVGMAPTTNTMFTLAHLSDPHLAPLPTPHWKELIGKRVTGYLNWQKKRRFIHDVETLAAVVADIKAQTPDHIAVTGDIANIALAAEFRQGRDWLESVGSPQDVSFVPGNHDIYVSEAAAFATRQWGPYMDDDEGVGGFPYVRRRGNVVLVGLSTGVPTAPFLATGWLGAKQLVGLAATLNQLRSDGLFRVVFIHHPPIIEAAQHKRLLDAHVLKRVIAAHGADLLLHGHDHVHMVNWLEGPNGTRVPAVGVPSASTRPGTDKDAAAYNLYRIDGRPGAWQCELISRGLASSGEVTQQKRFMLLG